MPERSIRSEAPEIMDDLTCSGPVVEQTLRELETINHLLGGNRVTFQALKVVLKKSPSVPLAIADLGCGSGEMLRLIERWAERKSIPVTLTGIDANAGIVQFARDQTPLTSLITYRVLDVLSQEFQEMKFDIVIGTLFFHHFAEDQLVEIFSKLKRQVNRAVIVNDIHRHPLAFHSIRLLTQAFSKSSMVKYDAPLSVKRAFRRHELVRVAQKAGFVKFDLRWRWAFRWQMILYPD